MCSLFSPLPMPDAASQGTKNFGMASAERHEDCHCIFPFLEWGSYHVHPQREDASVSPAALLPLPPSVPSSPWVLSCTGSSGGHAGWSGCRESRGSPGGAGNCLPSQRKGVGGDGAIAQWRQGTCLHIPPGAGSLAADEVR